MKIFAIAIVSGLAVFIGGYAASWRRASIQIGRHIAGMRWLRGEICGEYPSVKTMTEADITEFTHPLSLLALVVAKCLLFLILVLGLVMFTWYVSILIALSTYFCMEIAGFLFPRRKNPYYVRRIYRMLIECRDSIVRKGVAVDTTRLCRKIDELEEGFPELKCSDQRAWISIDPLDGEV